MKFDSLILECLPSSDDDKDKEEEKRSIITYEEGKKAFGIFKQYIMQLQMIFFLKNLIKRLKKNTLIN